VRDHSWISDGFRWCSSCEQPVAHEDYTRNVGTASGIGSRCRVCDRAANSAGYFYRKYKFYRKYELTQNAIVDLRAAQDDRCGICGDPEPQHLDHDHETGGIRQLLSRRCNHGLGLFRDDPKLLHAAAYYVQFHTLRQEAIAAQDATAIAPEGASRPGSPPVGSQRRPGARATGTRTTGRSSSARRRTQAGEADG
jgi:hypothetical protein